MREREISEQGRTRANGAISATSLDIGRGVANYARYRDPRRSSADVLVQSGWGGGAAGVSKFGRHTLPRTKIMQTPDAARESGPNGMSSAHRTNGKAGCNNITFVSPLGRYKCMLAWDLVGPVPARGIVAGVHLQLRGREGVRPGRGSLGITMCVC